MRTKLTVWCILLICAVSYSQAKAGKKMNMTPLADQALDTMIEKYWNPEKNYFNEQSPDTGKLTGYWTFAQAFDAILDGVQRHPDQKYTPWIDKLYQAADQKGWLNDYFDDENWMVLVLIRCYDITGDKKYLDKAEFVMTDIMANGWDTTRCGSQPGGIWWDKPHTQKATASNAGPALSAARLFQRTQNPIYKEFARMVYGYWWRTMVNPDTFQVTDHIKPSGEKVFWKFTYNEGLMIGASVELFKITGDNKYLENARHLAHFMITHETVTTSLGPVLFDGDNQQCTGDAHQFKGIGYRYLAYLYQQDTTQKDYEKVLVASSQAVEHMAWNVDSKTFAINWAGPVMKQSSLAQHSSAAMALNLSAHVTLK